MLNTHTHLRVLCACMLALHDDACPYVAAGIGSEALSMRSMPRIPPASGPPPGRFDSHTLANSAHPYI